MKIVSRLYLPLLGAMLATGIAVSCSSQETITQPGQVVFPASNVSFGRQVLPLFDLGCTYGGCHNSSDAAGGLQLTSYINLFRSPGLVRPGDSASSVLWQIVDGRLPHSYPIVNVLNANQVHGIAVWIQEGASNN
ncbi:MAG: c-type cytochrome domain-containing protein [Candidatus Kapaibacterium sp.]